MKRMLCLITALLLCMTVTAPAFAAEDDFVPSISYKESPDVEDAVLGEEGEVVDDCIVVTSIAQAENKTTDIRQEARDQLLQVYEELKNDMMELELDENYIVRELVDVSFRLAGCEEQGEHTHKDELTGTNATVAVTFKLGVRPLTKVAVLNFYEGAWHTVPSTNNGDGTVTAVFDHFSPVAFCVDARDEAEDATPDTGDMNLTQVAMWGGMMLLSGVALAAVLVLRRKEAQK